MVYLKVISMVLKLLRNPDLIKEALEALLQIRESVLELRRDYLKGNLSMPEIAKEFDVLAKELEDVAAEVIKVL